jgi:hypothetical protein
MAVDYFRTHPARVHTGTKALPPTSRAHARGFRSSMGAPARGVCNQYTRLNATAEVFRVHKKGQGQRNTIAILVFLESITRGGRTETGRRLGIFQAPWPSSGTMASGVGLMRRGPYA